MKCDNPKCGYEWVPIVKNPKQCPKCKRYLSYKENDNHD